MFFQPCFLFSYIAAPITESAPPRVRLVRCMTMAVCVAALIVEAAPAWTQPATPETLAPATSDAGHWGEHWDFSFRYGHAKEASVKKYSLIAAYNRPQPLWQGASWSIRLRHEIEAGGWHVPYAKDIAEAGYTPMFRLQRPIGGMLGGTVFFVEAGIGMRLLSHVHVSPSHTMSTAFQFSDEIGTGLQFGREGRATLGVRYQHISNANIKKPNPGMDFFTVYFGYRF
ncbi:acyloxyacyl hydrolase [Ottowia sp.]|uniref:acyloxyacyl hydrolase n=1 Tax=Ottowia sp. TaxID=1898956 RepID=UPI003A88D410